MSVVVTGAAGFIGAQLVRRLLDDGHDVIGIDRSPAMANGITALVGDLAQPDETMRSALREADAVFHLAGCPGVRDRAPDVAQRRLRDNVIAVERVLALTPSDVPLVVTSSSSVYGGARRGSGGADRPCTETDELAPRGGYARSKAALELRCLDRLSAGGRITILRPFTVAGEGQRPDMALSLWIDAARRGEPLRVLGSPLRRRDVTDVRDVVEACVRAVTTGARGIVNVGTGVGHTLAELAGAVQGAVGSNVPLAVEPVSSIEPPATLADTRRCLALLGFVPTTDLPTLVRRQVDAQPEPIGWPTSHLILEFA